MAEIISVAYDTPAEEFDTIYDIVPGDVFYYTKGFESVMLRIIADVPVGKSFHAIPVTPGTTLYTLYGTCLVVVENTVIAEILDMPDQDVIILGNNIYPL